MPMSRRGQTQVDKDRPIQFGPAAVTKRHAAGSILILDESLVCCRFFFFQAEDGIRDPLVTGVQTCALPISVVHRLREDRLQAARQDAEQRAAAAEAELATLRETVGAAVEEVQRRLRELEQRLEIGRASCRERG